MSLQGTYLLYVQCALDRVERAPFGNPIACPVEACGARHGRVLVVARAIRSG